MTEIEYSRKLNELERLLNDPDVSMDASRVWSLLDEVADFVTVPAAPAYAPL